MSEFDKDDKDRAATPTVPPLAGKADGVTATVTGPTAADTAMPTALNAGSVRLRRTTVALASDIGEEFITDCARNLEGAVSDAEVKNKWELDDQSWEGLATNTPLLLAVRAEHERRVVNGECAREAAQRHFAKAPDILNRILTDEQVAPRHRIEAARELRQAADAGPDISPGPTEKFTITINLGADETFVKEFHHRPAPIRDDEEPS